MASSTSKLHMALAAVLFLALVVAAAAGRQPATCPLKSKVTACAQQIIDNKDHYQGKEVLSPACCNELASQLGCACLVRNLVLTAGIDINKAFCVDGSGCPNY